MGWRDFFRRKRTASSGAPKKATVHFDGEAVICMRPGGPTERVAWDDLRAVLIRTTADGPFADDFFWILAGRDGASGCVVPSEAEGCDHLLERLQRLPGFDNQAVILASQSTEERTFLCWQIPEIA